MLTSILALFFSSYTPMDWGEYVLDEVCSGDFRCQRVELGVNPDPLESTDPWPTATHAGAYWPAHGDAEDMDGNPVSGVPGHWKGSVGGADGSVLLCCLGSPGPCWPKTTVTCGSTGIAVPCIDGISNPDGTITCLEA